MSTDGVRKHNIQRSTCNTQLATRSMCTAELESADGVRPVRSLATVRRTAASSSEFELSGFGQLALKGLLFFLFDGDGCLCSWIALCLGLFKAWSFVQSLELLLSFGFGGEALLHRKAKLAELRWDHINGCRCPTRSCK